MAIKLLAVVVILTGCAASGQYRIVVPGSGNKQAVIAENPTVGSNGSCYDMRTTDPTTHLLHDAGQVCGLFFATGYANAGVTIQTVTGDSSFQNNTTFRGPGVIVGATAPSSYIPTVGPYAAVISASNPAYLIVEGTTGSAALVLRNGSAGTDSKMWDNIADSSGGLHFRAVNDVYGAVQDYLTISRSGLTINSATINEHLLFGTDNSYNIGSSSSAAADVFSGGFTAGRALARQGSITVANTSTGATFAILGTDAATGGADLAVGNILGSSAIYPFNSSVDLGAFSFPFANEWVVNLTVTGTCTGCSGAAGANTSLSNLTPTSINVSLIPGTAGLNLGSLTSTSTVWNDVFSKRADFGFPATVQGAVELYNTSNSFEGALLGSAVTGADIEVTNTSLGAGSLYGTSNITLGNSSFPWSTLYVTNVNVGGSSGFSGTKTAGSCTITISSGIITNVTGC